MSVRVAAFDDPRFEPERLLAAARAVLAPFEGIEGDRELERLWCERFGPWLPPYRDSWEIYGIPGGWGADVTVRELEIITVRNRGTAAVAEAVIRARVRVRRYPPFALIGAFLRAFPRRSQVVWLTLTAAPGAGWELARADFGADGEYHLIAETVLEPARDPALHDAAVQELAAEERLGDWIVSTDDAAGRQLLDLSLADGRFDPAVVEAAVRSLIRAWRDLKIGDADAFAALSNHEIAEYARHADLPARLTGRIEVLALVGEPRPALFVRMPAVVQDTGGTRDRTLWWKLELDDALEQHWRLVDAYARPELRDHLHDRP